MEKADLLLLFNFASLKLRDMKIHNTRGLDSIGHFGFASASAKFAEGINNTTGQSGLAIYDIMRKIKNDGITTITTYGIGKVMSAGVLLLASGTKGKRMIGKNCRVMIHSVIAGTAGPMHQLENEFAEVKKIQDNYIQALVAETNMTEKEFRKLLKRKTNIYLSAEEAIELGIADEIF